MGRSLPSTSDGIIREETLNVRGRDWTVYSVGGSPAQAVLHGVLEIMPLKPDLVVSGNNYGENVSSGIAISGTVGAAMEAAALGIPALAVSLETDLKDYLTYSTEIDFSAAAWFSAYFGKRLLEKKFPPDVHLFKVDVPSDATVETPWVLTSVSHKVYFIPLPPQRSSWDEPARLGYKILEDIEDEPEDSDVFVLRKRRLVSVAPLSLDMTSRAAFGEIENLLRSG
jgi:5'-nucleotidase